MAGGQLVMGDARVDLGQSPSASEGPQDVDPTRPDVRPRDRERRLAVAGVLVAMLLGCMLRAAWAGAYLPWQHHWDEITNVRVGEEMVDERSVDPGFYNYPALVFLVEAVVLLPAELITGYDADRQPVLEPQTAASATVEEPGILRALRWATGVIPGVVMIGAAGAIAWIASRRWWAATLAATVAAVSALDLRFGVVVTPDALTGMAAGLAALGASAVTIRPSRRAYLLTGAAIGLATAAKYNGAAVALGLVAAHLIVHRSLRTEVRRLVEALAVAAGVVCLTNVGAVLHPGELISGIGLEANHYSSGHFGNEGSSPVFNAGWLWRTFGVALVLAPLSLLSTSQRVRRIALVLLVQSAGYHVFISAFPVRFARNLLPVTAPLAAASALGVVALVQRAASGRARGDVGTAPPAVPAAIGGVLVAALLAVPVVAAVGAVRSLDEDPWSDARAWVDENVPAGSKIVVELRSPVIDEERYDVVARGVLGRSPFERYRLTGVDYVIAVSETFQPFFDAPDDSPEVTSSYRQLLAPECVVAEFEGADQRIVIASPSSC